MSEAPHPSKTISDKIAEQHTKLLHIGQGDFPAFVSDPAAMAAFVNGVADAIWSEPEHRRVLEEYGIGRAQVAGLYFHAFEEALRARFEMKAVIALVQVYGSAFGLSRVMQAIAGVLARVREINQPENAKEATRSAVRLVYLTVAKESGA